MLKIISVVCSVEILTSHRDSVVSCSFWINRLYEKCRPSVRRLEADRDPPAPSHEAPVPPAVGEILIPTPVSPIGVRDQRWFLEENLRLQYLLCPLYDQVCSVSGCSPAVILAGPTCVAPSLACSIVQGPSPESIKDGSVRKGQDLYVSLDTWERTPNRMKGNDHYQYGQ